MKYSHSQLNRLIEKISNYISGAHKRITQSVAIFEARNFASKNLPASDEPSMKPYLTTIQASYTGLSKDVSVKLQGGLQKNLGTVNLGTSNQKIELKKRAIEKTNESIDHLTVDRNRIYLDGNCSTYQKYRKFLMLFALGEVIWTVLAFLKLGDIVLIAILLGITIGVAQISAVKTATQIIKEIQDKSKQKLYFIIAAVASFVFSLSFALLRYWFVHKGAGGNVPFIIMNPFTFVAINLLFIAATAMIVYFFYPSKEDVKKIQMREAIDKEIEQAEKLKQRQEAELSELMNEREYLMEVRLKIDHAEKKFHEKIGACYEEAVGVFKHENTLKRSDGRFPLSFNNNLEPLPAQNLDTVHSVI